MKYSFHFPCRAFRPAIFALAAAALCWQPSAAKAVAYSYSGALTASDPVFNRPFTTTSLSAVGTAVYYDVQPFTVSLPGVVQLSIDAASFTPGTADDSFLALYSGSFNPASPLTNLIGVDDDSGAGSLSLLSTTLAAGTSYFFVTTSYANAVTGTYSDSITPANALAVVVPFAIPEPSSLALAGVGLLGAAGCVRRKLRRS